jgi:hypothetical protein
MYCIVRRSYGSMGILDSGKCNLQYSEILSNTNRDEIFQLNQFYKICMPAFEAQKLLLSVFSQFSNLCISIHHSHHKVVWEERL